MNFTPDELTEAALRLATSLRAELAERLIASLGEESEIDPAWLDELDRRDAELAHDPDGARPAVDVFRRVRAYSGLCQLRQRDDGEAGRRP